MGPKPISACCTPWAAKRQRHRRSRIAAIETLKVNKLYRVYGAGDFVMMAPMAVVEAVFRMDEYSVRRVIKETRSGGGSRVHFNGRPNALGLASIVIVEA